MGMMLQPTELPEQGLQIFFFLTEISVLKIAIIFPLQSVEMLAA